MTDETRSDSVDRGAAEGAEPERRPRRTPSTRGRPRRVYLPWWALTALGALVGFATASWLGLVVGGVLGFFAWKLR